MDNLTGPDETDDWIAISDAIALRRLEAWALACDHAGDREKGDQVRSVVRILTGEGSVDGLRSFATTVNGPPSPRGLTRNF
jgi:hypothetical protein